MKLIKTNLSENKIWSNIKRWNWSFLIMCICVGEAGALGNKSIATIPEALAFGFIGGFLLGLPLAILTKDELPRPEKE